MAYTCVRVIFEIGHEAIIRNKKTLQGFTHDWELFVRGAENTDIHHFVDKVIFYLHDTFHNPKRVCKEPPYIVRESGYAGFVLPVEIYFKNKAEPHKIRIKYALTLPESGHPPISNVTREKLVFNNPSEDFRRKLIKGGGVGVVAESATSGQTIHMATLNSNQCGDEHKNLLNNKNKSSPQETVATKKSKKENTSKNEEQLNDNDPFSIFGQPIKTSNIPLVPKSSSKQISDKVTQPEKQVHSSKPPKHSSSSRTKDKDRDKEKDKLKEREKEKDKNSVKKNKDESLKKEKNKEEKLKVLKSLKDDCKKNTSPEEKPKEKALEKSEKELKLEKKEKDRKYKEDKKLKSKEKYKMNEKKENIDLKENYTERNDKLIFSKEENVNKEEKRLHKIGVEEKDDKIDKINKEKPNESKNLYSNDNINNLNVSNQQIVNNEKHKHHKHKKDKSKKDSKRDKDEKKEKTKESKESREKSVPGPVEILKITSKSESPKRLKKPLKTLFEELTDPSGSDTSSSDEEPVKQLNKEPSSPELSIPVKEEPVVFVKQEEQVKEEKVEISNKKKNKKSSEEKEAKKRKRKSKEKEENVALKMSKYENQSTETSIKSNSLMDLQESNADSRQPSMSPVLDTKFTDEYVTKLKELQRKIMTLDDNSGLQRIVQVVAETGQYEITTKTFDFDLCTLDESIVQRLLDFFVP